MGGTKKKTSKTTTKAKARSSKAPVKKRASGELGDDELEKVAGGVTVKFLTTDLATAVSPFANPHKEEIEIDSFSWGSTPTRLDKELTLKKK